VSSVRDMRYMFNGAINFNKDISSWDVNPNVTTCDSFSLDAPLVSYYKPIFVFCNTDPD
jgi:surface protein